MTTLTQRREVRSALQRADELGKRSEFLAFTLGPEAYALSIGAIVETLRPLPITEVPRSAPGVVGLMSVRGRLVTVMDLKQRFRLAPTFTIDKRSRILLVQPGEEQLGLLVDQILQVYRLSEAEIEPPGVLGNDQPSYVVGVGRPAGGPAFLLLDLRPLFPG